jgi:hypothetical protein
LLGVDDEEEDDEEEDDESEDDDVELVELSDFFSACLASFLSAPESADDADCRLRFAVP